MGKLWRLEAARGFAATYVLLHHATPRNLELAGLPIAQLVRFGQEAVILFFLLSGFVITYSFSKKPEQGFGAYFAARFIRIFTPLVPVLALGYGLACLRAGEVVGPQWRELVLNLLMVQDLVTFPGRAADPYLGNNPLWSLSYEWWFYMAFFPLMALVGSWRSRTLIVAVVAIVAAATYPLAPQWVSRLAMYMTIWWTGALMAKVYLSGERTNLNYLKAAWPLAATCVVLGGAVAVSGGLSEFSPSVSPFLELRHLVAGVLILIASLVWRKARWIGFRWTVGWFAVLAPISYGLYIVHRPVIVFFRDMFPQYGVGLTSLAAIAVSLALAAVLELGLFRSVRDLWRNRRMKPTTQEW